MRVVEKNPQFTNKLIRSASPYLRQHAHNPVFWHPWNAETLATAKAENKPILLSIGYSTCYWCHVMEREVFENPSIAALMNQYLINIKVDREEQPEIDEIYMVARQLTTQEGGWPNNVFLTPDLKPFYAGGTFGAEDMYGKPGFARLVEWVNYRWQTERAEVLKTAENIAAVMGQFLVARTQEERDATSISELSKMLFTKLRGQQDERAGGFGRAPKFPHETYLLYLMEYYARTREDAALMSASHALYAMGAGGLYDHVGGGFHRYCIDREWMVPHFEKMLYNQALLARVYTEHHRLTGNPFSMDMARSTLEFTSVAFRSPEGAFYSAIDAETDEVEGAFYAWDAKEIQRLLAPEEQAFFVRYYALAEIPHYPGHKAPEGAAINANKSLWERSVTERIPYVVLAAQAGIIMNKLLSARNARKAPHLDDKILTGWNGLMIEAFARGSAVFSQKAYFEVAARAALFLLANAVDAQGGLQRSYAKGQAHFDATLEDYAYFLQGLLMLYRVERAPRWLEAVIMLVSQMDQWLLDRDKGGYFMVAPRADVLHPSKTVEDSALPSPNAVMLHNFMDLYELTGDARWKDQAERLIHAFLPTLNSATIVEYTTFLQGMLRMESLHDYRQPPAAFTFATAEPMQTSLERISLGENAIELQVHISLDKGWYIYAPHAAPPVIPTSIRVEGPEVLEVEYFYPEADEQHGMPVYKERATLKARCRLKEERADAPLAVTLRCQPCMEGACATVVNKTLAA